MFTDQPPPNSTWEEHFIGREAIRGNPDNPNEAKLNYNPDNPKQVPTKQQQQPLPFTITSTKMSSGL